MSKLSIKKIFYVVGALAHERFKLLPNQVPFIHWITRHTLSALAASSALTAVVLIGVGCQNVSGSLLQVRGPKKISASAPVITANTTTAWSVKSTVSIVGLHYSVQPNDAIRDLVHC